MNKTVDWNPEDYAPIGDCVVCGSPVYPANPDQLNARGAVAHSACGW